MQVYRMQGRRNHVDISPCEEGCRSQSGIPAKNKSRLGGGRKTLRSWWLYFRPNRGDICDCPPRQFASERQTMTGNGCATETHKRRRNAQSERRSILLGQIRGIPEICEPTFLWRGN